MEQYPLQNSSKFRQSSLGWLSRDEGVTREEVNIPWEMTSFQQTICCLSVSFQGGSMAVLTGNVIFLVRLGRNS